MAIDAPAVCAAFGLPERGATLEPYAWSSARTWRLTTGDGGRFIVKRVPPGRETELAAAMAFEQDAIAAGIPAPSPVRPPDPAVGCAARLADGTLGRVSEWVDGRPIGPGDDLADWLGATLARLHRLRPLATAEPDVYGIFRPADWAGWHDEGRTQGRPWAGVLGERLADLAAATEWVAGAFARAGDYVFTHRDLEP
ncbi:phosphotransferase [Asanoa sp. NPDC049573]|uniref:phosphotransferase n=1 Tax=Asanoa sp. NPDC049573 TaxID=3155396 RepID=UPI00341AA57F